eukprot:tig00000889_g5305.t1
MLQSNAANRISTKTRSRVLLECARRVKREEALPFLKLLPLLDERAKQLEAYGFFKELIDLERGRNNHNAAAWCQLGMGDLLGAAASFRLTGKPAHIEALSCMLDYACAHIELDGRPLEGTALLLHEILEMAGDDLRVLDLEVTTDQVLDLKRLEELSLQLQFVRAVTNDVKDAETWIGLVKRTANPPYNNRRPDIRMACLH